MQQNEYQNKEKTTIDNRAFNEDPRETTYENTPPHSKLQSPPPRHSAWRALVLCLLAIAIALGILSLTGGFSFTSVQKSLPTRTFTINGHGSLVINDNNGSFHIHRGTTNQVIIQGNEHEYGLTSSFNNAQVQYGQQANTVTLNADEGWGILGSSGIDFTITVPSNLDVTIHGNSTDADLTDIDGQVNADTSSGNLSTNNVDGPLNLGTSSGDITIANEQNAVSAHTSSGNIHINQLTGQVDLSSSSGDITLDQAHISGQTHIQTSSGNIHFGGTLDIHGTYRMDSSSGDITLNLPANSSFQLTTATSSGDVNNDFSSPTTGSAPYATLNIQTSSGDINLRKQ